MFAVNAGKNLTTFTFMDLRLSTIYLTKTMMYTLLPNSVKVSNHGVEFLF